MSYLGLILKKWRGVCVLCQTHKQLEGEGCYLCMQCDDDIVWRGTDFVLNLANTEQKIPVFAAAAYEGVIKDAITAFKDDGNMNALPVLIHAQTKLIDDLIDTLISFDAKEDDTCIIPMATTNERLTKRGFYPVGVLAKYLAMLSNLPIYQGLIRQKEGINQRYLDKQARFDNIDDAFLFSNDHYQNFVLFDDVATTGATFQAAIAAIKNTYPAANIVAVCIAHGSVSV